MEIKTQEGTQHVASNAKGNAALTLGILGTSFAALNGGLGNGLLGGLFGGCGCNNQTNALMAELAKEKSERYTDQVGTEVYKQFAKEREQTQAQINALFAAIAQMDKTVSVSEAVTAEKLSCLTGKVNNIYDVFSLVVKNSAVCPGWGNITITPATTTTTG